MVEDALDPEDALRRAARRHRVRLQPGWPRREALQAAVRGYRELFRPQQATTLRQQRRLALQAMDAFARFRPRLFGALLSGDGPLDSIRLLLTADNPEQVIHHLTDRHIPWEESETVLIHSGARKKRWPAMRFLAGQTTVDLVVVDAQTRSDPPRDAVSGGPLAMADTERLSVLINREGS